MEFENLVKENLKYNKVVVKKHNNYPKKLFLPVPILIQIFPIMKKNPYNIYGFKRINDIEIEFATNCYFDDNYDENNVSDYYFVFDGKYAPYIERIDDLLYISNNKSIVKKSENSKIYKFRFKSNYAKPNLTSSYMFKIIKKELLNKKIVYNPDTKKDSEADHITVDLLQKLYTILLRKNFSLCGWKRINDNEIQFATDCIVSDELITEENIERHFGVFTGDFPLYIECPKDIKLVNTKIVKTTSTSNVHVFEFPLVSEKEKRNTKTESFEELKDNLLAIESK